MEKTIELVNLWGAFSMQHPNAEIEDFCRHLLLQKRETENKGRLVGGVVPEHVDGLLMKIIGRISKIHTIYVAAAFDGMVLNQIEEFGILATIKKHKNPKKSEVIYANLMELSSGTDVLNRLKNKGLIKDYADKEDKRSKRVELTGEGTKAISDSYQRVIKLAEMMFTDLSDDDKKLCIQLLKGVEIKLSAVIQKQKSKSFDEIYDELTS